MGFVVPGAPEGSTGRLVFVVVFGEARDRTCDPWFTRRVTYPLHHGGFLQYFTMLLEVHTIKFLHTPSRCTCIKRPFLKRLGRVRT